MPVADSQVDHSPPPVICETSIVEEGQSDIEIELSFSSSDSEGESSGDCEGEQAILLQSI